MNQRTPTPWVVRGFAKSAREMDAEFIDVVRGCDGTIIGFVTGDNYTADALHIVRCVNAHDALVNACKEIEEAFTDTLYVLDDVGLSCPSTLALASENARAALALAKEGTE